MTILTKIKNKLSPGQSIIPVHSETQTIAKVIQLDVDVLRAENLFIIYAQVPGASLSDIKISVEGDADELLIEGRQSRPDHSAVSEIKEKSDFVTKECTWVEFYRHIILPCSVDIDNANAIIKNGVLVLTLPLL